MVEEPIHTAVALRPDSEITGASPSDITGLLHLAVERQLPVETLERLVALHERVTDRAAAMEFAAALAEFQHECPPITKTSVAKITTQTGGSYTYKYAELSHVAEIVNPLLHARGLSYSWDSEITAAKLLVCTCTLRHVNGHREKASFTAPVENKSGMSEQQKYAAALSYARRMSLVQVLGITTADPDTDGGGDLESISTAQAEELKKLIQEVGADEKKFLAYVGAASIEEIQKGSFAMAKQALAMKRRGAK